MKSTLLTLTIVFNVFTTFAQSGEKQYYYNAKTGLENMLNGKDMPSYEKAVFLMENAWYNNEVKETDWDKVINYHIQNVQQLVLAHYNETSIKQKPGLLITKEQLIQQYKKALTNWAIYTYITQNIIFADSTDIYTHKKYTYSYSDPMASNDWANSQVIHLNDEKEGNCFALASLFKILADRLQSGAQLCTAPSHIYITHDDEKGVKYNVELGSKYFPGTGMISAITYTTDKAIEKGIAQRELTPQQQIALALVYLAKGYEHKFNTTNDEFILQCAQAALQYDSHNLNALLLKSEYFENNLTEQHKAIEQLQTQQDFKEYQNLLAQLYDLGYREMPLQMKNTLMKLYNKEKIELAPVKLAKDKSGAIIQQATLSWGLYDERHTNKTTERYGNTLFNTKTKQITAFTSEQNLYNNYNFDPVVFALNIDPLAAKYPGYSPYSFALNRPIDGVDRNGMEWKRFNPNYTATIVFPSVRDKDIELEYNFAMKAGMNVITVESWDELLNDLHEKNKSYQNLLFGGHGAGGGEALSFFGGFYTLSSGQYDKRIKQVGKYIKSDGSAILLGCFEGAPYVEESPYGRPLDKRPALKSLAALLNRPVYANAGYGIIKEGMFSGNVLQMHPDPTRGHTAGVDELNQAVGGVWYRMAVNGEVKPVGILSINNDGSFNVLSVKSIVDEIKGAINKGVKSFNDVFDKKPSNDDKKIFNNTPYRN
ncbi:MAG: hypothetical protein WC756_08690 [Taibaiella sp.]|jgi:hypothetical protein